MVPGTCRSAALLLAAILASACERASGTVTDGGPAAAVVDTVRPPAAAIERFREGLAEPAVPLGDGEASVEALVARWIEAVASHDTSTIRRLVLDRAEFAWLYYPHSPFSRRPLYQPPDLVWFRIRSASEKGIVRVLRRHGGTAMGYRQVRCHRPPRSEGPNRIREYCEVEREESGALRADILFGGIIERDGRFKFISYANQY